MRVSSVTKYDNFNAPLKTFRGDNVFAEFTVDNFLKASPITSNDSLEIKNKKDIPSQSVEKKHNIPQKILLTALSLGVATTLLYLNKDKIKNFLEVNELKKISKKLKIDFGADDVYRKRIAQTMGLDSKEIYKLSPIAGVQEMKKWVSEFESTPEVYAPGIAKYFPNGAVESFDNSNIVSKIFGANFHIHTVHSDGKYTVEKLLDDASKYADQRFKAIKKPFCIAITDHDSVQGCKEAVDIITKNPKKYKNLRVFLGMENTAEYFDPELLKENSKFHILSYGINPFGYDINNFLGPRIETNKNNIKQAIVSANEQFKEVTSKYSYNYNFDDILKIAPSIDNGIKDATFYMKDYLQFKMIYSFAVTNNKTLVSQLEKAGISLSEIDFAKPISMITKNPDYSKGQKYYEYYYKALQEYITNLISGKSTNISKDAIAKSFPKISSENRNLLEKMENLALNQYSSVHVSGNKFPEFSQCVSNLSKFSDGAIAMAHPGVFFPVNSMRDRQKLPQLYQKLYSLFKENGGDKAIFAEDFYQSYYKNGEENLLSKLNKISSSHKLLKTGSLDTHGLSVFSV